MWQALSRLGQPLTHTWVISRPYLPTLFVGFLVWISYALVNHAPHTTPSRSTTADLDIILQGFVIQQFDGSGHLTSIIKGREARYQAAKQNIHIHQLHLHHFKPDSGWIEVRARESTSNADYSEFHLQGDVWVAHQSPVRSSTMPPAPLLVFQGEAIQVTLPNQTLLSNRPIHMQRGNLSLSAEGMRYNSQTDYLELAKNVVAKWTYQE